MKKWLVVLFALILLAVNHLAMANLQEIYLEDGESHTIDEHIYQNDMVYVDETIANDPGTHINFVDGGQVGLLFAYNKATVNVSGGHAGSLYSYNDAEITMTGGSAWGLNSYNNSEVTMSGGEVDNSLAVYNNASVNMSGGLVRGAFVAYDDTIATLSGGRVLGNIVADDNSIIYLDGSEFALNGFSLVNGARLSNYSFPLGTITGTLADGSALDNIYLINTYTADIIIIPEPCSLVLLSLGGLVLRKKHGR